MKREIKFRAWDIKCNHWEFLNEELSALSPEIRQLNEGSYWKNIKLMQFTGLKDKNGKEIYEGDIVNVAPHVNCKAHKMKFNTYYEIVKYEYNLFLPFDEGEEYGSLAKDCEVVGNIYENPNLI